MTKQQHRTQDLTRHAILTLFDEHAALTRSQIATGIQRKKSPFLNQILDEMVYEGLLTRDVFTRHNGVQGYIYRRREG